MPGTVSLALLLALTLLSGTINHDGNPSICSYTEYTDAIVFNLHVRSAWLTSKCV